MPTVSERTEPTMLCGHHAHADDDLVAADERNFAIRVAECKDSVDDSGESCDMKVAHYIFSYFFARYAYVALLLVAMALFVGVCAYGVLLVLFPMTHAENDVKGRARFSKYFRRFFGATVR